MIFLPAIKINAHRNFKFLSKARMWVGEQQKQVVYTSVEDRSSYFAMPSKKEVFAFSVTLWNKYFKGKPIDNDHINLDSSSSQLNVSSEEFNAASRLGLAIGKRTVTELNEVAKTSNDDKGIKLACQNFISTNIMHPCLKQIFDALLLIKPTSIKNEQNVFSMSSNFLKEP